MAIYYFDTSALVKRYAQEPGTGWVRRLTNLETHNVIYTVRITGPEMMAAFFRKARTGQLSSLEANQLANDFGIAWQQQYQIIEVTVGVTELAMKLTETYRLRGYDAVHLAAALLVQDLRQELQLPALIFVSADVEQLQAAVAEGFAIENPQDYS